MTMQLNDMWYCVAEQMTEIILFVKLLNPQLIRTNEWALQPPLSILESVNMKSSQISDWIPINKI